MMMMMRMMMMIMMIRMSPLGMNLFHFMTFSEFTKKMSSANSTWPGVIQGILWVAASQMKVWKQSAVSISLEMEQRLVIFKSYDLFSFDLKSYFPYHNLPKRRVCMFHRCFAVLWFRQIHKTSIIGVTSSSVWVLVLCRSGGCCRCSCHSFIN